jgi:hypothetical protein
MTWCGTVVVVLENLMVQVPGTSYASQHTGEGKRAVSWVGSVQEVTTGIDFVGNVK